jgi:pimeloyl-ACP methyl ester carboxylesterase
MPHPRRPTALSDDQFASACAVTQHFSSDGVDIAFIDEGEGEAVLLLHGFASNLRVNWVDTGWVLGFNRAGRRVIAMDNRGHGESAQPLQPEAYGTAVMAEDARRLLDHLRIEKADVMGYSMGARIAAFLAAAWPERVRSLVLSGLGEGLVKGVGPPEPIAAALLAASIDEVTDRTGRAFRQFADQTGSNREALAACISASRQTMSPEELGRIAVPVLVAVGTADEIAGSPHALAAHIPGAEVFEIPKRDHMKAVGDRAHKKAVLEFLARQAPERIGGRQAG